MEKNPAKTNGLLKISNEVIIKIAELAACEITGVAVNGNKLMDGEKKSKASYRFINPVKIRLSSEAVEIDISIIVLQGYKAVSVAEAVQANIKSAVQNMTGIVVSKVNVRISGILINTTE